MGEDLICQIMVARVFLSTSGVYGIRVEMNLNFFVILLVAFDMIFELIFFKIDFDGLIRDDVNMIFKVIYELIFGELVFIECDSK